MSVSFKYPFEKQFQIVWLYSTCISFSNFHSLLECSWMPQVGLMKVLWWILLARYSLVVKVV